MAADDQSGGGGHRLPAGCLLYVKRWLAAPLQLPGRHPDGAGQRNSARVGGLADPGEPVHAFTPSTAGWPGTFRTVRFERYADDVVVHCVSRRQAEQVLAAIAARMEEVGLDPTRIRPGSSTAKTARAGATSEHTCSPSWVHLPGPQSAGQERRDCFTSFLPAMSPEALRPKAQLRAMRIHVAHLTLDDLARGSTPSSPGG